MSKRNVILLIVVLVIVVAIVFGFFYLYQPKNQTTGAVTSTNFFANFIPFGKSKNTNTPTNGNTPATDVSGYTPTQNDSGGELTDSTLKKISSKYFHQRLSK